MLEDEYCGGGCRAGVECACGINEIVLLGLLVLLLLVDLIVVGGAALL